MWVHTVYIHYGFWSFSKTENQSHSELQFREVVWWRKGIIVRQWELFIHLYNVESCELFLNLRFQLDTIMLALNLFYLFSWKAKLLKYPFLYSNKGTLIFSEEINSFLYNLLRIRKKVNLYNSHRLSKVKRWKKKAVCIT